MSGDGWKECKSMLSIGDDLAKSQESHAETGYFYYDFMIENCFFLWFHFAKRANIMREVSKNPNVRLDRIYQQHCFDKSYPTLYITFQAFNKISYLKNQTSKLKRNNKANIRQ